MSDLVPALLALDKGLNLQTAKIIAPPGTVLDSLNYEQVDFQGQKRIDGYTRYDGSMLSALDEYYVIDTVDAGLIDEGDILTGDDGVIGVVAERDNTTLYVGLINANNVPAVNDVLTYLQNGDEAGTVTVTSVSTGTESGATVQEHYEKVLALNASVRSRVEELPGAIIGLHWFEDRLYAVADAVVISLEGTTPTIYPNDTITYVSDPDMDFTVLDAYTLDNTRLVFLNAMDQAMFATGVELFRGVESVGVISEGYEGFPTDSEIASMFESRNELQVLEEDAPGAYDFGWRFVHLGWEVPYENGNSSFGSLPSVNQNIQGIGVQGPTSISGDNGRALSLKQKVDIVGADTQVNGWKSSNSSTTYVLDPDNIENDDALYIYADAYIKWDGTSGLIEAPGYTDANLIEYSPTATVEIKL